MPCRGCSLMLDGVRVVDSTTEIAGPYCSKLLADAGADVVKVERPAGDPLRHWGSGALFEYLNTSKRSVRGDALDLATSADIFISEERVDTAALWAQNPSLVVVVITPFGCTGPWSDHPSTEFTLQAACGSIGQRGLPDLPPLSAGGRLGEWTSGTYAALGAIAAHREAVRSGLGELVDVALLDCMAVTMVTYPSVFASFAGWPKVAGTGRTIEVPSIEPTRDGYFVVTTNSAQQFQDFLLMIERPDLMDDPDLPQVAKRFRRREEFLSAVHRYTTQHTTSEVLEAAALLRIPAGPLLNGSTVTEFEQFVGRSVFVPGPSGRFLQPRIPYRVSGEAPRPFETAPDLGQHDGSIDWAPRMLRASGAGTDTEGGVEDDGWRLPLPGFVSSTAPPGGPVQSPPLLSQLWAPTSSRSNLYPTRQHALRQYSATVPRSLVGVGSDLPRRQHRETGRHLRSFAPGRGRDARTFAEDCRHPGGELHPSGHGAIWLRLGPSPCAQRRAHHGPDACFRSRRPVAGSNGIRGDDGMSDRHVVADGVCRRPSGTRERRL